MAIKLGQIYRTLIRDPFRESLTGNPDKSIRDAIRDKDVEVEGLGAGLKRILGIHVEPDGSAESLGKGLKRILGISEGSIGRRLGIYQPTFSGLMAGGSTPTQYIQEYLQSDPDNYVRITVPRITARTHLTQDATEVLKREIYKRLPNEVKQVIRVYDGLPREIKADPRITPTFVYSGGIAPGQKYIDINVLGVVIINRALLGGTGGPAGVPTPLVGPDATGTYRPAPGQ